MNLKHNNYYKRRDGQVIQIVRYYPGVKYSWASDLMDRYLDNGKYDQWKEEHPKDLVEELDSEGKSMSVSSSIPITDLVSPNVIIVGNTIAGSVNRVAPPLPLSTPTASRHAHMITEWANGAKIQCKGPNATEWHDISPPGRSAVQWRDDCEFRIKPPDPIHVTIWSAMVEDDSGIYMVTGFTKREQIRGVEILKIHKIIVDCDTKKIVSEEWLSP